MSDQAVNYLYTAGAYAALAGVGYGIYHVSTQKKRAAIQQTKSGKSSQPETRKEDRKKKQRMESFTSESQESSEKASKSKSYAKAAEPSAAVDEAPVANSKKEEDDDIKFAKQLAKAQQGTKFATGNEPNKKKKKAKSVKQSRANNIDASAEEKPAAQSASSTNGADADDDQSATQSPVAAPADTSGVADMLEPAAAAPSVLRLTETEPKDNNKKKAAKAAEVVETKKQRQNRKKAEAAKAAREDAEKERKVLEEKQRRAARVGEGRAAKDGSQYTNAAAAKSAWKQGAPNGNKTEAAATTSSPGLLDTVDDEPVVKKEDAKPKAAPATQASGYSSLPSEEEQIEMLKEEDEWMPVKSKASKKTARKEAANSSGDETPAQAPAPAPAAPKAKEPAPAPAASSTKSKPKGPQNFGSFSALTSKDEPAEEVEEEWEV